MTAFPPFVVSHHHTYNAHSACTELNHIICDTYITSNSSDSSSSGTQRTESSRQTEMSDDDVIAAGSNAAADQVHGVV